MTGHDPSRVSPFGHLRVKGWLAPHRSFSQLPHVLHRLSIPRHPPSTLLHLGPMSYPAALTSSGLDSILSRELITRPYDAFKNTQTTLLIVDRLRKEVIQPQVPLRLPCYDLVPITEFTLRRLPPLRVGIGDFGCPQLSWLDGRCVQGSGTHSPRYADPRLLAIPASCRRVAAYNPN
jgi:hypothetical protein